MINPFGKRRRSRLEELTQQAQQRLEANEKKLEEARKALNVSPPPPPLTWTGSGGGGNGSYSFATSFSSTITFPSPSVVWADPPRRHGADCPCPQCGHYYRELPQLLADSENPKGDYSGPFATEDIEVARYGLRTFGISFSERGLRSLIKSHIAWEGGVIEAKCLAAPDPNDQHEAPHPFCTCGAYAATSLKSLLHQYSSKIDGNVAVVAAEGTTIIGDKGFRTAAARVVAYWSQTEKVQAVYEHVCGTDVKHYTDMAQMLKDYQFPEHPTEWPYRPLQDAFASYVPPGIYATSSSGPIRTVPAITVRTDGLVDFNMGDRIFRVSPPADAKAWELMKNNLEPHITRAGVDALRHLWGMST